ncbi:hypothetical protein [Saccharothrix sp. ST-888]|nr:hypothetical protein [Saccharothrix sp. ST-888]
MTASALDSTGIATVGGSRLLAGPNHLEPAWSPDACAQIDSWLS